jgi:two-component system response regulator
MQKIYILIAEDDADDRFLLETAFKECGFHEELVFVDNGVELVQFLSSQTGKPNPSKCFPGFIMLDLNMPKKDGREVLKEIKENPLYRKIPVVIFTTTKNDHEVTRCYELGANSYVVKPVNFDELVNVIREMRNYWLSISVLPG